MTGTSPARPRDECYRCGYDLRGIDNLQPCPECGLLAERSRRVSDELHNTRPKWLRTIAIGGALMVLAGPIGVLFFLWATIFPFALFGMATIPLFDWLVGTTIFWVGGRLLTAREHYLPADLADAWLRRSLRIATTVPLMLVLLFSFMEGFALEGNAWWLGWSLAIGLAVVGIIPLPLLIMLRLRGLAKRARSAHLAEHCLIVGIGASLSTAYYFFVWGLTAYGDKLFGRSWLITSNIALCIILVLCTAMGLFSLWCVYLIIRFAWTFWKASRQLRYNWRLADRAARVDGA